MLKTKVNYNKVFTFGWNIDGAKYNAKCISSIWIPNSEYFFNFHKICMKLIKFDQQVGLWWFIKQQMTFHFRLILSSWLSKYDFFSFIFHKIYMNQSGFSYSKNLTPWACKLMRSIKMFYSSKLFQVCTQNFQDMV